MKVDNLLSLYKLSLSSSSVSSREGVAVPVQSDPGSTVVRLSFQGLGQSLFAAKEEQKSRNDGGSILESLKKITEDIKAQRKAAARAKIQMIKQQIEGMLKFASSLTPDTAKQVANQIKQLAQQLKVAAAELMDSGGGVVSGVSVSIPMELGQAGEMSGGDAEAATAQAAASVVEDEAKEASEEALGQVAAARDEAVTADSVTGQKTPGVFSQNTDQEREADKGLIQDVARKLKVLFALVRAQLRDGNSKDVKETESTLQEIDKLTSEGESINLNL